MQFNLRLMLLLICFASAGNLRAAAPALRVVKTIRLPDVSGRIDHMAIDASGNVLFVAALGNNSIEGVNVKTGAIVARATRTREPQGICIVDQKVFVASGGDGMLRAYDFNLRELAHVEGLQDADNVRYDPSSKLLYVGFGANGKGGLAIIDPQKVAQIGTIPLPGHPESFQISPDGKRIWVNVPKNQVMVIDPARRKTIDQWSLHWHQNFPMALDQSLHHLLIATRRPAKLILLDSKSGKQLGSASTVGDCDDVWVDEAGFHIFVTGGWGFIDVYNRAKDRPLHLIEKIPTADGARTSLFDPRTRRLYVAVPKSDQHQAEIRVFGTAGARPATTAASEQ